MSPSRNELRRRWAKFRDRFEAATTVTDDGQAEEALRVALELAAEDPSFAPAWLVIGGSHFSNRAYREALEAFDRILADYPRSEKASLGRFHCLWNLGDEDGAFDEIRRYMEIADSEEYRRLIADMADEIERKTGERPS